MSTSLRHPIAIALVTGVTFARSLENGFTWDDKKNLLDNLHYRGLGASELAWMFTGFHMGHYAPVTWITLGLDYVVWGLNPVGYHLTGLLLHAANAVAFYLLATRLLTAAAPRSDAPDPRVQWAGALAALLFAVHPLRVESVAWATERRDVLSAFFYLGAILAYLRATKQAGGDTAVAWPWYCSAVGLHGLALLSKSMAVSLPVVLLVLDVYPLRRLGGAPRRWLGQEARSVYLEKLPFVVLSLTASVVAIIAARSTGMTLVPLSGVGIGDRLAISVYALAFYLWKTVVPIGLSPLYELVLPVEPGSLPYLLSGGAVTLITWMAVTTARRCPALAAVWTAYVAILLPVVGIVQNGPQIAADRYTYLACLGWPLLLSGALLHWRGLETPRRALMTLLAGLLAVVVLASLTSRQVQVWRDSERLWRHAVSTNPSAIGHHNLGVALLDRGALAEASIHFRETILRQPDNAHAHTHLGVVLARAGNLDGAIEHFRRALGIDPGLAAARANLARALNAQSASQGGVRP